MISAKEAEALVLSLVEPLDPQADAENVGLLEARSRVLAVAAIGKLDVPHWDNSAMDGYAMRYADVAAATEAQPVVLEIVEEIPAGKVPQRAIATGQAARIFTGSMLPAGADTIVMQENVRREGDRVAIPTPPARKGEFVRCQGAFYRAGEPLLPAGTLLGPAELAVLAGAQQTRVRVFRRPKVTVFSTGDELVAPEASLGPGQLVDSNSYALGAACAGAEVLRLGIVRDEPAATEAAISRALETADFVFSTGGVSVGDRDCVESALERLGGKIRIRSVAMKPGKPLKVATFEREGRSVLYFGLPGNPVSALVGFWRFARPALGKFSGLPPAIWQPAFVRATTLQDLRANGKRETYLWGQLYWESEGYVFLPASGSHNSANAIGLGGTTGLAVVPVGETCVPAGSQVDVLDVRP